MTTEKKAASILLIVDDESSVCRALTRMLNNKVDEILTAINATEAETVLGSRKITHLICDHWFGPGQPLGIDLVEKWKNNYPSIKRAVVLTGNDISNLKIPNGVDEVMDKTARAQDLANALKL